MSYYFKGNHFSVTALPLFHCIKLPKRAHPQKNTFHTPRALFRRQIRYESGDKTATFLFKNKTSRVGCIIGLIYQRILFYLFPRSCFSWSKITIAYPYKRSKSFHLPSTLFPCLHGYMENADWLVELYNGISKVKYLPPLLQPDATPKGYTQRRKQQAPVLNRRCEGIFIFVSQVSLFRRTRNNWR